YDPKDGLLLVINANDTPPFGTLIKVNKASGHLTIGTQIPLPLKATVFEKLDSIIQASSLVELVNSFIRPSLNSSKGQITQETLNLIMFYHNHRRYKSGKRQGKAPIELLTGEALEADWVALLLQHTPAASQGPSLTSSAPLALVPHHNEHTAPSQMPPDPAIVEPSTESTLSWSPMDAEAS